MTQEETKDFLSQVLTAIGGKLHGVFVRADDNKVYRGVIETSPIIPMTQEAVKDFLSQDFTGCRGVFVRTNSDEVDVGAPIRLTRDGQAFLLKVFYGQLRFPLALVEEARWA
jgi:hypothetical protein